MLCLVWWNVLDLILCDQIQANSIVNSVFHASIWSDIEACGSLPGWERAEVIEQDMNKSVGKGMEAAQ